MFLEDLEEVAEMGLSVVLFGFDFDVVEVVGLFPEQVGMVLYEVGVIDKFPA